METSIFVAAIICRVAQIKYGIFILSAFNFI